MGQNRECITKTIGVQDFSKRSCGGFKIQCTLTILSLIHGTRHDYGVIESAYTERASDRLYEGVSGRSLQEDYSKMAAKYVFSVKIPMWR